MLLFLLLPLAALADGRVFPPVAVPANVTIPDQRALIHFTNGLERLVIETRFTGSGTNFAWVVPLPSPPTVEAATTGLFPTLQHLFQPKIIHRVTRYYLAILAGIGFGYLLLFVRVTKRVRWLDVLACAVIGACAGLKSGEPAGMGVFTLVFIALMLSVIAVRVGSRLAGITLWILLMLAMVGASLIFPALSSARTRGMESTPSASEAVSILDRRLVGVFETTTIASREPQALQAWLRDNGYAVSAHSEPVIADYVKDGWVFVAAKVRRDRADQETSTPHPLSFTFKTARPVYPMRLTGVDNGSLDVELYVFGPARAGTAHFTVRSCARPNYPGVPAQERWRWSHGVSETPNIVHPLLRRWVQDAPVVTKLSATLSPADMRRDVWIDWRPFAEKEDRRFSRLGASSLAMNWASALFAAVLLGLGVLAGFRTVFKTGAMKGIGLAAVACLVLAGAIYLALPKIQVRLVPRQFYSSYADVMSLGDWVSGMPTATAAEVRSEIQQLLTGSANNVEESRRDANWYRAARFNGMSNPLLDGPVREEDSPGNFVLTEKDGLLIFYAFDAEGAPHGITTWNLPK